MYAMQGYGGYGGFGTIDTTTTAGSQASTAYGYLQTGDTTTALSYLNLLGPADRQLACTMMAAQAQADGGSMPAAVAALCAQPVGPAAGPTAASVGPLGLSTTTWIVLALGGVGLVYLLSSKKKAA